MSFYAMMEFCNIFILIFRFFPPTVHFPPEKKETQSSISHSLCVCVFESMRLILTFIYKFSHLFSSHLVILIAICLIIYSRKSVIQIKIRHIYPNNNVSFYSFNSFIHSFVRLHLTFHSLFIIFH